MVLEAGAASPSRKEKRTTATEQERAKEAAVPSPPTLVWGSGHRSGLRIKWMKETSLSKVYA